MKRILLTGATGFIGSHVVDQLLSTEHQVTAVVRTRCLAPSSALMQSVAVVGRDEITGEWFREQQFDAVIHCAAAYGREADAHSELVDVNVAFPLQLLDYARSGDTTLFLYLDTCFTLDYPYLFPYTLSKKQMVQWGRLVPHQGALRFVNLNLQHPFGPRDRAGKFVPWLIQQCRTANVIELTSGQQEKDFIYVEDVASAICHIIGHGDRLAAGFHEFQCGRGEALSVRAFVELVHTATESSAELRFGAVPTRPGEIPRSVADVKELAATGWRPQWSVAEGIQETLRVVK